MNCVFSSFVDVVNASTGEPDKELNPKKKVWEAVQPELCTNNHLAATYKGVPCEVQERGECRSQSMCDAAIR